MEVAGCCAHYPQMVCAVVEEAVVAMPFDIAIVVEVHSQER